MKDQINLVILPLYRSKNSYPYDIFYNLADDKHTLDLSWLETQLSLLETHFKIKDISLEGGEISELSDIYSDILFKLLKIYSKKIKISTNFINYNKSLINEVDIIDVLYNYNNFTDKSNAVFKNIKAAISSGKIINIKSLDISVDKNELEIVANLNKLGIKSWEIIPYQQTEYTNIPFKGYDYYESVISKYLKLSDYMRFSFINKLQLDGIIKNNNFNKTTVYITPNNKYGVGIFDKKNNFSIKELNNLDELENYLKNYEKERILICKDCKYKLDCLCNRYCNLNYTGKSCCGLKNLIKQTKGK